MKTDNNIKMNEEELKSYLGFRKRGHKIEAKKGKGSVYHRNKVKEETEEEYSNEDYLDPIEDSFYE